MIDINGLWLCKLQGNIFEKSIELSDSSSSVFIRRYMNSNMAKILDRDKILMENATAEDIVLRTDEEYGNEYYGKEKFSADEMYWIGYIYRYCAYTSGYSSKTVYKKIGAGEMRELYYPFHTMDPANAIERILEKHNMKYTDRDMIAEGVEIMRSMIRA